MTVAGASSGRTYRLPPRDRTGWMFGLSLPQLLVVSTGIVVGTSLMVVAPVPVGLAVMVVLGGVGAVRVRGESVVELIPHALRYVRTARGGTPTWFVALPVLGGDPEVSVPPVLKGHELLAVDAAAIGAGPAGSQIAVSWDTTNDTISASLRVAGRQFGLLEPGEQDWLVTHWSLAIQSFVNERTPVMSIRWSEWAAPAGLDEHRVWLDEHLAVDPIEAARAAYEALLRDAGTAATRHETLLTVTVHINKVRRRRSGQDRIGAAVDTLIKEVRLFAQRLGGAGLVVSAPLSPTQWARAVRLRLDPGARLALDGRLRSLGEVAGGCVPSNALPLASAATWAAWQTDSAYHRGLLVTDWPRLDVHAGWLKDLLLWAGTTRSVTVLFEPIARSKSYRSAMRDAAKIETDSMHRTEKGFRVGANHRRARQAVEEREEELVSGYAEFSFVGMITVTASSLDTLDDVTAEVIQVAASIGLDLRPLHGRHDLAAVAALPVARGVVPKEWL